jgi:hypothetical protein
VEVQKWQVFLILESKFFLYGELIFLENHSKLLKQEKVLALLFRKTYFWVTIRFQRNWNFSRNLKKTLKFFFPDSFIRFANCFLDRFYRD